MKLPVLLEKLQQTEMDTFLDMLTRQLLNRLGVPTNFAGYHYLRAAILAAYKEPSQLCAWSKEIYPTIAEQFDSSESRVERAMRYAIEETWSLGDQTEIRALFPSMVRRPDNSRFITRLVEELRLQIANEQLRHFKPQMDVTQQQVT